MTGADPGASPQAAARRPAPVVPLVPTVQVGPFRVWDEGSAALVGSLVEGTLATLGERPYTAFALHVGGLNDRRDLAFRRAMAEADVVYADGMSVVWLARLAGAEQLERCGTTDLGWSVLHELNVRLGRPARVALLGGPDGLTHRAGVVLEADAAVDVVATEHGYHRDWDEVLARVVAAGPDVLVVGLGAPREMVWVQEHLAQLPPCLVLTCGGWFGFLAADERRAPAWMQSAGLEWCFRVLQAPRRLAGRYARGAGTTLAMAAAILRSRSRRR